MKISIVGAGPAGLYFAILMKKANPADVIRIYERNRIDDTFGFGVVFSDQTLDTFETYDPESYWRITSEFAYWDDIEINFKGTRHRIGGNGFCGCSRKTLLVILYERARDLGVEFEFGKEVEDVAVLSKRSDLVILADGVNSRFREQYRDHFQPKVDLRPNKFVWMGSTAPLDAFKFMFEETPDGIFIGHAYQYEAGRSTWIFETDAATFERAGLADLTEEETGARMERIFARYLDGHPILTNRSLWRNFPMIRNARWVKDNMVLLGDAKATAHFSIGSGTKLAMEDAIALFRSFTPERSVSEALEHFENDRRGEVERTQHSADVSLVWFEHLKRFWSFDPIQFAFGVMTRAKAITYDNLRLRAPDFIKTIDRHFALEVRENGFDVPIEHAPPPMFQPFGLRDMTIANRVVMSPMCMYCAQDGMPTDWHFVHYGARAVGGAGIMFTEMVCVAPDARITHGCAGLWTHAQEAAWRRIVDFVHAHSTTKICLQLGHAGRKGATKLMWEGMDRPLDEGGWEVLSASPLPYFPDSRMPREMSRADMDRVTAQFAAAAVRGERCGFDMLELHSAHGYLLASFLSPLTNRRTDDYGGTIANRLRFPLEVFDAMRAAWPRHKPMSVRISATDWAAGGIGADDAVAIAGAFAEHGVDLVDVSTGQTVWDAEPMYGRMYQTPFADQIRNEAQVATMCVGNITTPDQVNTILAAGRADLVALGRPHLVDPFFTMKAAAWYGVDVAVPPQYLPGKDQVFRNAARDRADLEELKIRGKPKTRAELKAPANRPDGCGMSNPMPEHLLIERPEPGVVLLRIHRPEARNALNDELRRDLAAQFGALAEDEAVRCVVITGSDPVFVAGADIKAMAEASPSAMAARRLDAYWAPLKTFPKPLIAAVNGWALGGGCELAMHADIIVAGESAKFGQPEIKLGIIPGAGGTQRLTRAVGKFKAMKLLLTGEPVSAHDAEAMELVSEVVADAEVVTRALALAASIAALPPLAARRIKELVLQGAELPLDAALAMERQAFLLMFDTEDQKEGMRAFIEKRKPRFTGR